MQRRRSQVATPIRGGALRCRDTVFRKQDVDDKASTTLDRIEHSDDRTCYALCRIRDLNDEINKLIREKGHWEVRIVELGGPDYAKAAPKVQDSQGFEIQGATGKGAGYR